MKANHRHDEPDFAILIAASYRALIDELRDAQLSAGLDVRPSFGFVIRSVAAEEPTINRLAELLDVTKQAASQLADEAEDAGFVERFADPSDRRRRRLRLTPRGEQVRAIALARSAELEAELAADIGPDALAACRRVLIALITRSGALDDVLARRSRMVR